MIEKNVAELNRREGECRSAIYSETLFMGSFANSRLKYPWMIALRAGCGIAPGRKVRQDFFRPKAVDGMTALLFSCENATCAVPEAYREIFYDEEDVLTSSLGWEPGSLNLGQAFAMRYRTPLVHGDVTRLLIDLEKEGDERWSRFALKLPESTRLKIAERHEKPYRTLLKQRISEDLRRHQAVLHLMIHTDSETEGRVTLETPVGGMLAEKIAAVWRLRLNSDVLDVRHFRNSDCLALGAALSLEFPAEQYAQVRLKVSQSFFLEGRPLKWEAVKKLLLETLAQAVAEAVPVISPESPSTAPE